MEADQTYFKAFKFRLEPTPEQTVLLSKHFGCTRFLFNHFLEEKQRHYKDNRKTPTYNGICSSLTALKKQEEFSWLTEVNAQSLQASLKNLEAAYGNFFKKRANLPKFKSKKKSRGSFHCPQAVRILDGTKIKVHKFKEGIKFIKHRELKGTVKSATFSKNPSGKYYVSILCELPEETPLPKTGKQIGVDLGLKDFAVLSDGQKFANLKFLNRAFKELKRQQKHLQHKQKGSNRRELQRLKVAGLHEKITNSRSNTHHQLSSFLVKR